VTEFDADLARLAEDMLVTMYEAPGVGLAAPQVGVQKCLFVYDVGDGPGAVVNPTIVSTLGEWEYEEGCLSVPGLSWPIVRAKHVHLVGYDLEGARVSMEGEDLMARMFQHECDHLDGVLLLARLDHGQRKKAMKALRQRAFDMPEPGHSRSDESP